MTKCPHCGYHFNLGKLQTEILRVLANTQQEPIYTNRLTTILGKGHTTVWQAVKSLEKAGFIKRPPIYDDKTKKVQRDRYIELTETGLQYVTTLQ